MRKLLLRQLVKDIGLIFFFVQRFFKQPPAGLCILFHTGVMPGRHGIKAACHRLLQKRAEFDGAVAVDAWVRRVSRPVFADKPVDYLFTEAA